MTEVLNNQKTLIDNATNQTVYQVYDQAVVALKAKAAEINKTIYKNKLDSLVDSSLYTINQTALADAITAGKNAVEEATTTEAIIAAFNEAKTVINAIDNDEAALNKYKRDKSSELAKYKNESEYTTNLSALRQALTNGTNAISAAASINEVDQALASAKSVIDQIKSDKELLDELKADAINDVNDVAELKTTALNASSFDDKATGITKIQSIKTKAATDINQCKNAVDINEIKTKAISDIENEYKLCALSLADLKASLALDLNDLATEKLALESVKDDADAKTEITTSKNDGLALINGATTKEAATLAYNEARDAILEAVKKTLISGVNVIEAKGDQESVYVTWGKNENVDTYNVYYKESSSSNWTKIDSDYLIRTYAEYNRVDIVGLKAGSYDVKVQAVVEGDEINSYAIVNELTVISYDRTGFAFDKTNANPTGDASGAYNADGTLKSNARVIYVTSKSAKTVKLKVKQDNKGTETEFTGLQAIIDAHQKGAEDRPLAIRFVGQVSASDMDKFSSSGEGLQIKGRAANSSMKMTFEGIGEDASIYGFGFLIRNCNNVEVRNLGFMTDMDDDVSIDTDNSNIWVHDNDFFYGHNGSGDHAKGDGALDIKGTMHATLSYNHFWDTGKTTLNSNGDEVNFVSYHHNWYDHSDSRHPRVRKSSAIHVYNNYFDGVSKYGVGATTGSSIFVENNYFRNTKFPVLISMQGSDIYAGTNVASNDNATFSKESGGMIKTYGNYIEGATTTYVPYGKTSYIVKGQTTSLSAMNTLVDFDCYEASSRDEKVAASIVTKSGGTPYSNFDTDTSIMYTYTVQTPEEAVETVKAYSGRVNGGDLKWVFDNQTEDTNYAVIPGLRKAIDTYKTKLLSIKAEGVSTTPVNPTPNPQPGENAYDSVIALINALPQTITLNDEAQITAAKTAYDALSADDKAQVTNKSKLDQAIEALNALKTPAPAEGSVIVTFTAKDTASNAIVTVSGNLKSGIAAKEYNGVSYTTALKMESATSISLTLSSAAKITIVTDTASKKINVDGSSKTTGADGILSMDLAAGSHTITKGDTMNLYCIIVEYK